MLSADVMRCFRAQVSRYHIEVTETDPGTVPHTELMVGRAAADLGAPAGIPSISPSMCGGTQNAIAFVFGDAVGPTANQVCWQLAAQLGYTAGLEPTFYCPDVMSSLSCAVKDFADVDAGCGSIAPVQCGCGPSQNSHAFMIQRFGAAP